LGGHPLLQLRWRHPGKKTAREKDEDQDNSSGPRGVLGIFIKRVTWAEYREKKRRSWVDDLNRRPVSERNSHNIKSPSQIGPRNKLTKEAQGEGGKGGGRLRVKQERVILRGREAEGGNMATNFLGQGTNQGISDRTGESMLGSGGQNRSRIAEAPFGEWSEEKYQKKKKG